MMSADLERELIADTEGGGGGALPGEGLELGVGLVGVDLKVVVVVEHRGEVQAVALGEVPFEAEGSTDTVDVGVGVAEELIIGPRVGGGVVGGAAFRGVENVAQLNVGVGLHGLEASVLDHQAGLEGQRVENLLVRVDVVGLVSELEPFAKRETPVSGVDAAGQVGGESVPWPELAGGVGIVPDKGVIYTSLQMLVQLVGRSDRELVPLDSGERVLRADLILSVQMETFRDFPIQLGGGSPIDVLGGNL